MKKILLALLSLAIFFYISQRALALAADLEVTCGNGCSPLTSPALYGPAEIWYPAKSLTKIIKITNSSSETKDVAIKALSFSQSGDADLVFRLQILKSGNTVWNDTMRSFWQTNEINLGGIGAGSSEEYSLKASMDGSAGNEFQAKTVRFNLNLGFLDNGPSVSASPALQGSCCSPTADIPGPVGDSSGGLKSLSGNHTVTSIISSRTAQTQSKFRGGGEAEVLGAQNQPEEILHPGFSLHENRIACPWWLPSLIMEFLAVIFYIALFLWKSILPKGFLLFPALLALGTFSIDHFFAHSFFLPSQTCRVMWFLSSAVAFFPSLSFMIYKRRQRLLRA